jgi:hypothetical protein
MQGWHLTTERTQREYRSLRYRWHRFLDQREAELDCLAEIVDLAQSIDDGAYSDERALRNYEDDQRGQPSMYLHKVGSPLGR